MYFEFACSNCGKNLKVRPEHAGRRVACPYCRVQITVPQPEEQIEDVEPYVGGRQQVSGTKSKAAPAARRQRPATDSSARDGWGDSTNVSMLLSGAIGLGIAAVFYILMFPFASTYVGQKFIKAGSGFWVTPATTFLLGWALAMLILKSRKLKRQKASMLFDLLPNELGRDITVSHIDNFVSHIRSLPVKPGESFLINRVLRGLEHFRVRRSAAEVSTVMASQSEIDSNAVDSSYTLVKVLVWAIPILGFIGTVIGIGDAVGGFGATMESAGDVAALKVSLQGVIEGLGTAFDTTLVALVWSMVVMFPASSMQKSEEDLLNWVDEYCNENLLKRLDDGREGRVDQTSSPVNLKRAIDEAMAQHHAELRTWSKKLEAIGGTLTDHVTGGWTKIQQDVQLQHQRDQQRLQEIDRMLADFQSTIASVARQADTAQSQLAASTRESAESMLRAWNDKLREGDAALSDQVRQNWDKIQADIRSQQEQSQARMTEIDRALGEFQSALAGMSERSEATQTQLAGSMRESVEALNGYMEGIERGLRGLSDVLADLGQQQVIVQQAPRRGWFFGRRNGGK